MNLVEWLISIPAITFVIDFAMSNRINSNGPKVVGGSSIKIREVPYLLALHSEDTFLCGGVILSPVWAMTALHCINFKDEPVKTYYIRVGSSVVFPIGPRHRIRNIYNYSSKMNEAGNIPVHDIVLIRLRNRIRFTDKVRPAKLPRENSKPPDVLRVAGWGSTIRAKPGEYNQGTIHLKAANVTRVSDEKCIATSDYKKLVNTEWHLCYGDEKVDACHGDSGGPLGDSTIVYGIVSFGEGCAHFPGVYVKLSYYRRWIKRITKI